MPFDILGPPDVGFQGQNILKKFLQSGRAGFISIFMSLQDAVLVPLKPLAMTNSLRLPKSFGFSRWINGRREIYALAFRPWMEIYRVEILMIRKR